MYRYHIYTYIYIYIYIYVYMYMYLCLYKALQLKDHQKATLHVLFFSYKKEGKLKQKIS